MSKRVYPVWEPGKVGRALIITQILVRLSIESVPNVALVST